MVHSRTAAALYAPLKVQLPKAITRNTSRIMKDNLVQKEARRMRCSRKSVFYSQLAVNCGWEGRTEDVRIPKR